MAELKAPFLYRGMPAFREAVKIGTAGPLPDLGVWRNLVLEMAINAVALGPQARIKDIQTAVLQWAVGVVAGAVGDVALERLVEALMNALPNQYSPVHPSAIVPDRMMKQMNRIRAGWGDELRAAVVERQQEVSRVNSESNVVFAERAFGGAIGARVLSLPPGSNAGYAKSVAVSNVPPTLAGFAVGARVAANMVRAEIRVPRMEALKQVLAGGRHERYEEAAMKDAHRLPLFFVHQFAEDERDAFRHQSSGEIHSPPLNLSPQRMIPTTPSLTQQVSTEMPSSEGAAISAFAFVRFVFNALVRSSASPPDATGR